MQDYSEDEDERELLRCEEPKLSSCSEDELDEMMDPSFEELLFDFIVH